MPKTIFVPLTWPYWAMLLAIFVHPCRILLVRIRTVAIPSAEPVLSGVEGEAILIIRKLEIAAATCCGLAMTIAGVSRAESEHPGTKNRLPESLVAPRA
jgi:hypothetical protein